MRKSTETTTMTTISDLPRDLLIEIVSRIPLKHTREVRLTCKNWNSCLIQNRSLGKGAMAKEGESHKVVLMDYNLHLMNIDTDPELKGKLTCLYDNSDQVKISQVFHCDGLLSCILKEDNLRLVVWNPYWGQTRWIKPRYTYPRHDACGYSRGHVYQSKYMYAFGYENKSCRNQKILRFLDTSSHYPRYSSVLWYEIYNFESDLWTSLALNPYWRIYTGSLGVSLKGNTYWCAKNRTSPPLRVNHIICFDFTSERFGQLIRLPFSTGNESPVKLSCVREEKLAALFYYRGIVEVWITTKIVVNNVLWSKFLTVNVNVKIMRSLISKSYFLDEVKKVVMLFSKTSNLDDVVHIMGEPGYVKQKFLGEHADKSLCPLVCSYVPSLVQIKQPAGEDRKQQSALEKRRYDGHLLRILANEERFEGASKRRKRDSLTIYNP